MLRADLDIVGFLPSASSLKTGYGQPARLSSFCRHELTPVALRSRFSARPFASDSTSPGIAATAMKSRYTQILTKKC